MRPVRRIPTPTATRDHRASGRQDLLAVHVGSGTLRVLTGRRQAPAQSLILRVVLPALLLLAATSATLAALPLLTEVLAANAVMAATPAEAIAAGIASGQPVTLTATIDDARRVRSPQRGAPAWYAPVAGSSLLVRTDDPERLRLRPLTVTGRVTTLGALAEDRRVLATLRDGRGAPVTGATAVLVERDRLGTALLAALALMVSWSTALASVWLLRWESGPSPDLGQRGPEPAQGPAASPALAPETAAGA